MSNWNDHLQDKQGWPSKSARYYQKGTYDPLFTISGSCRCLVILGGLMMWRPKHVNNRTFVYRHQHCPPCAHDRSQYLRLTAYLFYIQALHPAQIRISYHDPPCNISVSPGIYDSEGTMWFDYLNGRAITKVIAGRTLLNAEAYVGEVDFKPR